jgi:hypothetical protein
MTLFRIFRQISAGILEHFPDHRYGLFPKFEPAAPQPLLPQTDELADSLNVTPPVNGGIRYRGESPIIFPPIIPF